MCIIFVDLACSLYVFSVFDTKIFRNLHFDRNQLLLINQMQKSSTWQQKYLTTTLTDTLLIGRNSVNAALSEIDRQVFFCTACSSVRENRFCSSGISVRHKISVVNDIRVRRSALKKYSIKTVTSSSTSKARMKWKICFSVRGEACRIRERINTRRTFGLVCVACAIVDPKLLHTRRPLQHRSPKNSFTKWQLAVLIKSRGWIVPKLELRDHMQRLLVCVNEFIHETSFSKILWMKVAAVFVNEKAVDKWNDFILCTNDDRRREKDVMLMIMF